MQRCLLHCITATRLLCLPEKLPSLLFQRRLYVVHQPLVLVGCVPCRVRPRQVLLAPKLLEGFVHGAGYSEPVCHDVCKQCLAYFRFQHPCRLPFLVHPSCLLRPLPEFPGFGGGQQGGHVGLSVPGISGACLHALCLHVVAREGVVLFVDLGAHVVLCAARDVECNLRLSILHISCCFVVCRLSTPRCSRCRRKC